MLLEVPVSLFIVDNNKLLVAGGGERKVIPLPIQPYKFVEDPSDSGIPVQLIGGGRTKISTQTWPVIPAKPPLPGQNTSRLDLDYILDIIKDYPDEVKKLSQPAEPYPIFIDIETAATTSHFSKAHRDEILTIQIGFTDSDIIILEGDETQMIRDLIGLLRRSPSGKQPDMVVGYFLNKFDIPYIKARAAVLGIHNGEWNTIMGDVVPEGSDITYPNWLYSSGRTKGKDKDSRRREESIDTVRGLLNFDLYIHAKTDGILKDLPSRTLKNVATFYGAKDVKDLSLAEKSDMGKLLRTNRDKFMEYAISDVKQTMYLYDIYLRRVAAASNLLQAPFTLVHRMSSGQKSYLALYREVRANGFYSLKKNYERYENLYQRAEKFQGALVDCFRTGYFPHTIYVDAKCMAKDTEVLTNKGYKRADTLKAGDFAYTDMGYRKIAHVERTVRTDLVTVTTCSGNSMTVSAEHRFPVYIKKRKAGYSEEDSVVDKTAGDLTKNDILLECYNYELPLDSHRSSPVSEHYEAELLGIFDAEGTIHESTRNRIRYDRNNSIQRGIRYTLVSFSIHVKETALRDRIDALMHHFTEGKPSIRQVRGKNALAIQYGSHEVYDRFKLLLLKKQDILKDVDKCRHYLRGLFSGDGHYNKARKTITLTQSTVNKDNVDFAHKCLIRCGIPHAVTGSHKAVAVMKPPKVSTVHAKYTIEIPSRFVTVFKERIGFIDERPIPEDASTQQKPKDYIRSRYMLSKIRSITKHSAEKGEEMIDIMIDDQSHPYFFANNILTHNSLYPNIMHDFNLGYDRYRVEKYIPYMEYAKAQGFEVPKHVIDAEMQGQVVPIPEFNPPITAEGTANSLTVHIPDDNYQLVLKFQMDVENDGFMRKLIVKYNDIRDQFKKLAKSFQGTDKIQAMNYDSTQQEAKVINNTFYGIQGNRYYEVADLPAAIFVTAIGRWIMQEMITLFESRNKGACIEIDTDGLLLDFDKVDMSIEDINTHLRQRLHDTFKIPLAKMKFLLEFEGEGSVYMYKTKNYLIREKGKDTWKAKGSAFARYDTAPVIQRAVQLMGDAIMMHGNTAAAYTQAMNEARDIQDLPREAFLFTKTLKKNVESYKGYQKARTFVKAIPSGGTKAVRVGEMKKRAKQWVAKAFGRDINTQRRFNKKISDCQKEAELDLVLGEMSMRKEESSGNYYILDMIMRIIASGGHVEEDDVIEFYYTKTSQRYTMAQEMTPDIEIDRDRYLADINLFLKRFEFADPVQKSLDMMEFLK